MSDGGDARTLLPVGLAKESSDPRSEDDETGKVVPSPYKEAGKRARWYKALLQMMVGVVTVVATLVACAVDLVQGDAAVEVQKQVFLVIGVGLAVAAGVELA